MSTSGLNIVIGKMGRSIYFNRDKWKDGAGNNEAPLLFSTIARLNPQNTYYLIGKSDFERVPEETIKEWFPHGNVVNCWKDWNVKTDDPTTWISKVLENVKIDFGIIHGGMVSLSIPNKIYCLDRKTGGLTDKLRSPLASLVNYVSPITWYLNESGIPWLTVTSDGRYSPMQARDLINVERASIGVKRGVAEVERFVSYDKQDEFKTHQVELIYGFGEGQYLLDKKQHDFIPFANKTQKIGLFFHQYDDKKRIKFIQSIVDAFSEDEIAVYGKWKNVEDNVKYKGTVNFDELQTDILPSIKYTVCYPITPGDISAKWVEAASKGIIPFFHESYDKDRLLTKCHDIPDYFWIEDAEDLKNKITFLELHPEKYGRAAEFFRSAIANRCIRDGSIMNNIINETISKYI